MLRQPKSAGVLAVLVVLGAVEPSRAGDDAQGSALAEKTALLNGECTAPRITSTFGMDLLVGQMTGIRPSVALFNHENSSLLVEGYYGGLFTKFGAAEAAGAGVRWVASRGGIDSVTFGPGVDVLFNLNDGKGTMLAPTVDLAWRHSFGHRAAFVLGINAGVGIGLSGRSGDDEDDRISGKVTPLISFYSGLRY